MTTSIFGSAVHRVEDPRFLMGASRYVDDLPADGALRARFVRSIMAHARILGVDTSEAAAMPGVAAVLLARDLDLSPQPPSDEVEGAFERPVLAEDVVRFVGEPVALVLAESAAQAQDAAETVMVDLDPLDAVIGPEAAADARAALLFPTAGSNVAAGSDERWQEDVLAEADVVVRLRVRHQRLAPVPMEPNALLVEPGDDGPLTLWVSTQVPFDVRDDVAERLGLERDAVRVVAPDVGGGFGAKLQVYPEYLACAAAAVRLGRLRQGAEPDAGRGPGARRAGTGHRPGALRGGRLRRFRHADHLEPDLVPDPRGQRAAGVRDGSHRDADPAQPAGGQGDRRVRDRGFDRGRRERHGGCPGAPRRSTPGSTALPGARLARDRRGDRVRRVAAVVALGLFAAGCTNVDRVATALTTSPSASTGSPAPGPSPTASQTAAIDIETPLANGEVANPVSVTGTADVVDASLTVRVLDANGQELAAMVVQASCGDGCAGRFAAELFFFVERRQPGTIEVTGISDAEDTAIATVPVVLVPA